MYGEGELEGRKGFWICNVAVILEKVEKYGVKSLRGGSLFEVAFGNSIENGEVGCCVLLCCCFSVPC